MKGNIKKFQNVKRHLFLVHKKGNIGREIECIKMMVLKSYLKKIKDVAFAIQNLSKNQLGVNELYTEVMKIEGFEETTLGGAFDHLIQNEMLTKAFMAKKMLI